MSIQQVPMWRVTCDACGGHSDSDYWAWGEREHAVEEWEESDGCILPDGQVFHRDCLPDEFCFLGHRGEWKHTPGDDDPSKCGECEKAIPTAVTQ